MNDSTASMVASATTTSDDAYSSVSNNLLEDVTSALIRARLDTQGEFAPRLIANTHGGTMIDAIKEELTQSDSFDMSVAFISPGTVYTLFQDMLDASRKHTRATVIISVSSISHNPTAAKPVGRIITSTKSYFNRPEAFRLLLHLQEVTDVEVRVWGEDADANTTRAHNFHPKGYIFTRHVTDGQPYVNLYVGSSNLTDAALSNQREWNLRVSSLEEGDLINQVRSELDEQIANSMPLTKEWITRYERDYNEQHQTIIERYEKEFKKPAAPLKEILEQIERDKAAPIKPNAMQREALANLAKLREEGERRAIIISATGTGKTILSALDAKAMKPSRLLYVTDRSQILQQAMKSYQRVLDCGNDELGLLDGTNKQSDRKYVFATRSTLAKDETLAQFAPDEFDYVLIDEVHHAGADSYRRIIDHFSDARFMLGMTATPERTDGINIFELFDYNVAYEIRLQQALDENMLCPFHYYGVAEYVGTQAAEITDMEGNVRATVDKALRVGDEWQGSAEAAQLKHEVSKMTTLDELTSRDRVRYIIDTLQKYPSSYPHTIGLVFCSRQEEAHKLSRMFNEQWNQQAERKYRTVAVTSKDEQGRPIGQKQLAEQRANAVERLEHGELDYIFTVDLFNEGIDIPTLNQVVMLRNTESSIVFTQQLGRGLRKAPHKDGLVVIDFIGNYANNYLIPVALYGNGGSSEVGRRNLQRGTIGLSSISFDEIARERVLASLDAANWSEMAKLNKEYENLRFRLGRIPMLVDFYAHDPSMPYTVASKKGDYLAFILPCKQRLASKGSSKDASPIAPNKQDGSRNPSVSRSALARTSPEDFDVVTNEGHSILKMLTSVLLRGLRPHELVMLDELCGFGFGIGESTEGLAGGAGTIPGTWNVPNDLEHGVPAATLADAIATRFPDADLSPMQFESALLVLNYEFFTKTSLKSFGTIPLIDIVDGQDGDTGKRYVRLSPRFAAMLRGNPTFRDFLADTVRVGLFNCRDLFAKARKQQRRFDRSFLMEQRYSYVDIMRLCGWKDEMPPQSVGGYKLDEDTGSMPIIVKYASSQYEDEFLGPQEMRWFSKNGASLKSPAFQWLRKASGNGRWEDTHFVPLFVMRQEDAEITKKKNGETPYYYYVGHVAEVQHPTPTEKPTADGSETVKAVVSTLRLARPLDPELYRHLTGRHMA